MVRFTILASGSAGNCSFLETEQSKILVDAGLSGKQIELRLSSLGRSLREVQAVFITHEHEDHVRGLAVLARRFGIPVYVNRLTCEQLRVGMPEYQGWRLFDTGSPIEFQDLRIETFAVPHDAYDPVGFVFHHQKGAIGFLTDLGYATKLVTERMRGVRALVLETNYDPDLLQADTKRPWSVKQRILSRHGHLSNSSAAALAAEIVTDRLEDLFLGHLSSDCNNPDIAERVVRERLAQCGNSRVRIHKTSPSEPSKTLEW